MEEPVQAVISNEPQPTSIEIDKDKDSSVSQLEPPPPPLETLNSQTENSHPNDDTDNHDNFRNENENENENFNEPPASDDFYDKEDKREKSTKTINQDNIPLSFSRDKNKTKILSNNRANNNNPLSLSSNQLQREIKFITKQILDTKNFIQKLNKRQLLYSDNQPPSLEDKSKQDNDNNDNNTDNKKPDEDNTSSNDKDPSSSNNNNNTNNNNISRSTGGRVKGLGISGAIEKDEKLQTRNKRFALGLFSQLKNNQGEKDKIRMLKQTQAQSRVVSKQREESEGRLKILLEKCLKDQEIENEKLQLYEKKLNYLNEILEVQLENDKIHDQNSLFTLNSTPKIFYAPAKHNSITQDLISKCTNIIKEELNSIKEKCEWKESDESRLNEVRLESQKVFRSSREETGPIIKNNNNNNSSSSRGFIESSDSNRVFKDWSRNEDPSSKNIILKGAPTASTRGRAQSHISLQRKASTSTEVRDRPRDRDRPRPRDRSRSPQTNRLNAGPSADAKRKRFSRSKSPDRRGYNNNNRKNDNNNSSIRSRSRRSRSYSRSVSRSRSVNKKSRPSRYSRSRSRDRRSPSHSPSRSRSRSRSRSDSRDRGKTKSSRRSRSRSRSLSRSSSSRSSSRSRSRSRSRSFSVSDKEEGEVKSKK